MLVDPELLAGREQRFTEVLRQAGVKVTLQRLEIFREVAGTQNHPDVESIFRNVRQRLPMVSLDTVYRTLWLLLDLGLISPLGAHRKRARFDGNLEAHHHFICERCGLTRDFTSAEFNGLKVPEAAQAYGEVRATQVEVRGVCNACLKRED